jgi:D-alanyl-D-alanine carboxypeptidase/D-alanyl-D-alanine-endopeptidase (penicillin-binding protein 4)
MRNGLRTAAVLLAAAWPAVTRGGEPLAERVNAVLQTQGYQHGRWGLLVVDAKSGQTVYERSADERFRPASVTKLFSTAAALVELGADYRFHTPIHRRGEVDGNGTLRGDLILIASGDLSLGGRTGPDGGLLYTDSDHSYARGNLNGQLVEADPRAGLDSLAREVRDTGIKTITGDIIIDDRLFPAINSTGSGPSQVTPIIVNDNIVDVLVTPGAKAGDPATVKLVPETCFVSVDAQVETGAEGTTPRLRVESYGPRRFAVRGSLPVGHRPVVKIFEIDEPASFARALLIEALRARGVKLDASPMGRNATEGLAPSAEIARLPKVAEYTSPPFREYAKVILKVSQNLHASALPMLLAAKQGQTTLDAGLRRQGEILKGLGIDIDTISFGGGAGGSNADLVTPRAVVALLRAMRARDEAAVYEEALPVLGRDGTLARAVPSNSPARGHIRAKTGTYWVENGLNGRAVMTSKALAGYMETASGRQLVFAFFLNDVPLDAPSDDVSEATAAANRLLGRLCEVVYDDLDAPAAPAAGQP